MDRLNLNISAVSIGTRGIHPSMEQGDHLSNTHGSDLRLEVWTGFGFSCEVSDNIGEFKSALLRQSRPSTLSKEGETIIPLRIP